MSGGVFRITLGALYPALQRLERSGLVKGSWSVSDNNRRARYYTLTAAGRRRLSTGQKAWERNVGRHDARAPRGSGVTHDGTVAPRARDRAGDASSIASRRKSSRITSRCWWRARSRPASTRPRPGGRCGSRWAASNPRASRWRKAGRDSRWSSSRARLIYAARVLRRSPGVTLLSVATMGVGIGVSTILFALVNGIVLRPLPYPEPDRLVRIFDTNLAGRHRPRRRGERQHRRLAPAGLVVRRHRRVLRDGTHAQHRYRRRGADHRAGQRGLLFAHARAAARRPDVQRGRDAAGAVQQRGGADRRRPGRDPLARRLAAALRRRSRRSSAAR